MNKRLMMLLFAVPFVPLAGMDWPVPEPEILTTFGSNNGETFSTGILITGDDDRAAAVEDGEVIFVRDAAQAPGKIPSGLGNFVVLQHQGGLVSGYTHIQDGSIPRFDEKKYIVSRGDSVGAVGDSGWAYGPGLGLTVYDDEFSRYVNPYLVLPQIADTQQPVMENLIFAYGDKRIVLEDDIVVPEGNYDLIADIYDVYEFARGYASTAPYTITVFVNGAETEKISFEGLYEKEGETYLLRSDEKTFDDLYAGPRTVNIGRFDLSPGRMSIEIMVADFAGNEIGTVRNFIIGGQ